MQYYVTTHLIVDESAPTVTVNDAVEAIRSDQRVTVPSFDDAIDILTAFGLSRYKAQRRVRFARTGQLVLSL